MNVNKPFLNLLKNMPAKKRKAAKAKPRTAGASTLDAFNKKKKPAKKKPAAKPKRRS